MIARIVTAVLLTQLCSNSWWLVATAATGIERVPFVILAMASSAVIVLCGIQILGDNWNEGLYK